MKIIFIRHGKTVGNIEKRYIGKTDEELSSIGIAEIQKNNYYNIESAESAKVISSPLKRCIQTAELIYSKIDEIHLDLRECDFGNFENKNYEELKNNNEYIKWLESGGKMGFPEGESYGSFCERCCRCFENIIKQNLDLDTIIFVVHGGTIMAILEQFSDENKTFFDWQTKNGQQLIFELYDANDKILLKTLF